MLMTMLEESTAPPPAETVEGIQPLQPRAYMTSYNEGAAINKWRVSTGFRKLQKRIHQRHKSGKSGVVTTRSLPPLADEHRKDTAHHRKKVTSGTSSKRVIDMKVVPSEVNMSLYRTSNNGLTRISARMSKVRKTSSDSIDYSDTLSDNNIPTATTPAPNPPRLPVIDKSRLLKQEVEKLDRAHNEYSEEVLEERIVGWIRQCKMWGCYDGVPYDDLDRKQRTRLKSEHTDSRHTISSVTEPGEGIIIKQGILKKHSAKSSQVVKMKVSPGIGGGGGGGGVSDEENDGRTKTTNRKTSLPTGQLSPSSKHSIKTPSSPRKLSARDISPSGGIQQSNGKFSPHRLSPGGILSPNGKYSPTSKYSSIQKLSASYPRQSAAREQASLDKVMLSPRDNRQPAAREQAGLDKVMLSPRDNRQPVSQASSPNNLSPILQFKKTPAQQTEVTIQQSLRLRNELSESKHSMRRSDMTDSRQSFWLKSELSQSRLRTGTRRQTLGAHNTLSRSKTMIV